jgi:putative hydrolase of the HAD superfamily
VSIRWVVFDAVGTLIYPTPDVATVYHRVGAAHGSVLSRDEVLQRFRTAFRRAEDSGRVDESLLKTSEPEEIARWQRIVADVFDDLESTEGCFRDLFDHFARPNAWACFDDVAPAVTELRAENIQIAVASNFDSRLHPVCEGLPPLDSIDVRVVSSEVGFNKPASGFYSAVQRMLGVPPDEVLVVGDDAINDVQGAAQAGMRSVLIDRGGSRILSTVESDEAAETIRSVIHSLTEVVELIA